MSKIINTLFTGKVLYEFDSLPSTNQFAQELLKTEQPSEGTLIVTHDQYAGRGQINNKWESEAGKNLTFSLLLFPKFLAARKQFLLNQAVSLSVYDTLKTYIPKGITIKWPNDIYAFDKKITGILIQNNLKGSTLQSSIIGIGLNINQKQFLSDAPNPTSIALEIGVETDLLAVLNSLCQNLEARYLQLKAGKIALIQKDYQNNLFRLEEEFYFKKLDNTLFKGKIVGVTDIGKLIIKTANGQEFFAFKEVAYIF